MLDNKIVTAAIESLGLKDFSKATIREIVVVANKVEAQTGVKYVHMEMGVPGLRPDAIGTEAEISALKNGVAAIYPALDGVAELKEQTSRFVKAFIDVDIPASCCIPTSGSMQGAYALFTTLKLAMPEDKDTVLFIDPGFPVQKTQADVVGLKHTSFDMFNYRGQALLDKIEDFLKNGNICALLYSNPNNPSWMCLTEDELKGIADLAEKYDCIIIEDLAYFGMDFRKDISHPFEAPFQPSVAKYSDRCVMMISGSKAFSYAGQRIGVLAFCPALFGRQFDVLKQRLGVPTFGGTLVGRVLYCLSSGTAHSAQLALAAMFKAATDGSYNFLADVHEYEKRAAEMKRIFIKHGFNILYADDLGEAIGDGFYFTVAYKDLTGGQLMRDLLYYGVSAIPLDTTGSLQQGLRVCTSFVKQEQMSDLDSRLAEFDKDHTIYKTL